MSVPHELRALCALELAMAMQGPHSFVTVRVEEPQRTESRPTGRSKYPHDTMILRSKAHLISIIFIY